MPGFNSSKKAHTTGFQNSCAFNTVAHLLITKLRKNELGTAITEQAAYPIILQEFNQYYSTSLNWDDLKKLFAEVYVNPIDRELVLAPVLRKTLSKIFEQNLELKADLLNNFLVLVNSHLSNQVREQQYENIYRGNEHFFQGLKAEFDVAHQGVDEFIDNKRHVIETYWQNTGYSNYSRSVGDLKTGLQMSEDEIANLTKALGITLEVYDKYGISEPVLFVDSSPTVKLVDTLKLYHKDQHWEFEVESNQVAKRHNDCYPKNDQEIVDYMSNRRRPTPKFQNIQLREIYCYEDWEQGHGKTIEEELKETVHAAVVQKIKPITRTHSTSVDSNESSVSPVPARRANDSSLLVPLIGSSDDLPTLEAVSPIVVVPAPTSNPQEELRLDEAPSVDEQLNHLAPVLHSVNELTKMNVADIQEIGKQILTEAASTNIYVSENRFTFFQTMHNNIRKDAAKLIKGTDVVSQEIRTFLDMPASHIQPALGVRKGDHDLAFVLQELEIAEAISSNFKKF